MDTLIVERLRSFIDFSKSYLKKEFINHKFSKKEKEKHDYVTDCDFFIEDKFKEMVLRNWPDASIVAEERNTRKGTGKYTFVIDPIDGTNNFSTGIPIFGTSISVFKESEPYYSIVYLNAEDYILEAYDNKAFLNSKEIKVSKSEELYFLLSDSRLEKITKYCDEKVLFELADRIGKMRMLGAAVYNISYVALGHGVIGIEYELKPVDYPACCHFLENADGIVEPFHGAKSWKELKESGLIFAANDDHLRAVKEIVKKYLKSKD